MKKTVHIVGALVFCLLLTGSTLATTWSPKEFTCPIDNEKNTFMVIGGFASA